MTNWAVPEFSRNRVDKAGFTLVNPAAPYDEMQEAFKVINNWRSAHSYPLLHFRINLMRKVSSIHTNAIIAQRIKRLESISAKLTRQSTQLSQMQDIGGCRAVVGSVEEVKALVDSYKESRQAHEFKGEKDYIDVPKPDGYRGRHLIYSYKSARGAKSAYDKLRIEIQIRTYLQHAWATAVEAVGIFTRQALKANVGDEKWLRLFALMSTQIAQMEGAPAVPDTPLDDQERLDEIRELARDLRAVALLKTYRATINYLGRQATGPKYYLVEYDYTTNVVDVKSFQATASQAANMAYTQAETGLTEGSKNIVLVSVDSVANLEKAYPNYFLDTEQFTQILERCIRS